MPLFDSGEADGLLFYVMPFVEGETLRGRLDREKQLPVNEAIRITIAVAGALDYAHRHNVVHRDLKPENILLQDGQPVVSDFGIALAVTNAGGTRVTQTGLSLGTPHYMSPEQATGDRVIDARSDIYSLAAVLYEMLIGEPPHTGIHHPGGHRARADRSTAQRPRHARDGPGERGRRDHTRTGQAARRSLRDGEASSPRRCRTRAFRFPSRSRPAYRRLFREQRKLVRRKRGRCPSCRGPLRPLRWPWRDGA